MLLRLVDKRDEEIKLLQRRYRELEQSYEGLKLMYKAAMEGK